MDKSRKVMRPVVPVGVEGAKTSSRDELIADWRDMLLSATRSFFKECFYASHVWHTGVYKDDPTEPSTLERAASWAVSVGIDLKPTEFRQRAIIYDTIAPFGIKAINHIMTMTISGAYEISKNIRLALPYAQHDEDPRYFDDEQIERASPLVMEILEFVTENRISVRDMKDELLKQDKIPRDDGGTLGRKKMKVDFTQRVLMTIRESPDGMIGGMLIPRQISQTSRKEIQWAMIFNEMQEELGASRDGVFAKLMQLGEDWLGKQRRNVA